MDVQEGSHGDEGVREFFSRKKIQNHVILPEKYLGMQGAEGRPALKRNFYLLTLADISSSLLFWVTRHI